MTTTIKEKPLNVSPEVAKEVEKLDKQFNGIEQNLKGLTLDNMNTAPLVKTENTMSQKEVGNSTDVYLKPVRSIGPGINHKTGAHEKFNEKFRQQYDYQKEYVNFVAYNNMITGEDIEMWTKPFPGCNCDFWKIPCNKPVWGPRFLAEQLTRARHHNLTMKDDVITSSDGVGTYHGTIIAKETTNRLDAKPVPKTKQISMFESGVF